MHTINGTQNTYVGALALVFTLLACFVSPLWAQTNGEEGDDGYDRVIESNTFVNLNEIVEQPTEPVVLGNYPNPFNPETTLRFEVRDAEHVRLGVFNALGQQVQVLVDGWVEAGVHEARFDGFGLPSGTYFSRLVTEAGSVTRAMVLAK